MTTEIVMLKEFQAKMHEIMENGLAIWENNPDAVVEITMNDQVFKFQLETIKRIRKGSDVKYEKITQKSIRLEKNFLPERTTIFQNCQWCSAYDGVYAFSFDPCRSIFDKESICRSCCIDYIKFHDLKNWLQDNEHRDLTDK